MLERQPALMRCIETIEIGRDGDYPVENPERDRSAEISRLDQTNGPDPSDFMRILENGLSFTPERQHSGQEQAGCNAKPQSQQYGWPAAQLVDQRRFLGRDRGQQHRLNRRLRGQI
jgi:hypothetical protein